MKMQHSVTARCAILLAVLWWCIGCAALRPVGEPATPPGQDVSVQPAPAEEPLPPAKSPVREKLQAVVLPRRAAEHAAEAEKLYTLQMSDADVRELLLACADQAGLDIMIDPRVEGTVTIDVKQVTLDQLLATIAEFASLTYVREDNLIKVSVPKIATRIFHLNYVASARQSRGSISGSVGGSRPGREGAQSTPAGGQSGSGGFNEVTSKNSFDVWEEINAGLTALKSADGTITIHRSSNSIVVDDYPANLKKMAEFIEAVEASVQRQVVIEANIIEVLLGRKHEAGINWDFVQSLPQMRNFVWGLSGRGASEWTGYPGSTRTENDSNSGGSGDTQLIPGDKRKIRPFSGVFTLGMQGQAIALTDLMKALSTQGETRLLSSPRISTLNNQPAIIKIAQEDVYFETTRSTTYGETNTETRANFLTVGIVMSVVPQISADGIITMTIHPSITEKAGEKKSPSGDTVPVVNVRETETVARTANNQTVLIGGLIQDKRYEDSTGLPGLMHVPYVGRLFRFDSTENRRTELVIMLTPRIVTELNQEQFAAPGKRMLDSARGAANDTL